MHDRATAKDIRALGLRTDLHSNHARTSASLAMTLAMTLALTVIPPTRAQVSRLDEAAEPWDLIYIHSAHYGRTVEPLVGHDNRSVLRRAGHRRVTHAYALSRRGVSRIATCGYRESLLPFDDFLSSLHAGHPRPDVMALSCVRHARGELSADEPFVGLTFPDDAALCTLPSQHSGGALAAPAFLLDSDSKVQQH